MDLALARRSGQEFRNNDVITNSPALAPLRRLFRTAVRSLVEAYEDLASSRVTPVTSPSICDQMCQDIALYTPDSINSPVADPVVDIPVVESLFPLIISSALPWPVEETSTRSITPNNRSLTYLQTGPFDPPHCHVPLTRGAVSSVYIASTDLLYYVEPLPLDHLVCHITLTVRSWPTVAREELLAVAHRDMVVARRNVAVLTRYLDLHSVHLAACSGALEDTLPLMSAETFPRVSGGVRSILDDVK